MGDKFKVGDKVHCIDTSGCGIASHCLKHGEVYIVTAYDYPTNCQVKEVKVNGLLGYWLTNRFELVESAQTEQVDYLAIIRELCGG